MAIWIMTSNGHPATNADGTPIPPFNDGTGMWPGHAYFSEAEKIAANHLASLSEVADGMQVQCEQTNSYNRISGTHTYTA
jgi:hypothetical protein